MSGKQPPKQSFHPIKNEIIESEPIPGTSTTNLQNLTDLRIRNSLNTILIQPNNQDVLASSQMRPPKSGNIHNFRLIIDGGVCASAENTRFCLGVIGNINRNPFVTKVGRSIGKGIRLNQKDENIYLESLSDSAVFVQCPLFARKNGDELATVYRLKASDASTSSSNGSSIFF
uniref:MH2 domain-containing protein n=1 Tax=Meloidogyne javanica TaxID=6303 RepID=A0A915MZJ2_MELJA